MPLLVAGANTAYEIAMVADPKPDNHAMDILMGWTAAATMIGLLARHDLQTRNHVVAN